MLTQHTATPYWLTGGLHHHDIGPVTACTTTSSSSWFAELLSALAFAIFTDHVHTTAVYGAVHVWAFNITAA